MKIFRKLRFRFIQKQSFRKYLIYAIGEIILVVLGILIALQINNHNEQSKNNTEQQKILKSLHKDFGKNQFKIMETIQHQNDVVEYSSRLISILKNKTAGTERDSIGTYITDGALSTWNIEPVMGTYDALIGSGKLNLIKNDALIRHLAEFNAEFENEFEDSEASSNLVSQLFEDLGPFIQPLLSKDLSDYIGVAEEQDQAKRSNAINTLLNLDDKTCGLLVYRTLLEKNKLEWHHKLLHLNTTILELLKKEIDE